MSNKFCIAPFKNAVIDRAGNMLPCCEYMIDNTKPQPMINQFKQWWATDLNHMRDNMLNGVIDPGCHHCLAKENNQAMLSARIHQNKIASHAIPDIVANYKNGISVLDSLEIRVSNYCNLSCLMCGSYASSSIAQEYIDHSDKYQAAGFFMENVPTVRWWDDPANMDLLKKMLAGVEQLTFAGGEPLIVPEVVDILNFVNVNKIKTININTNLTKLSSKFIDAFSRFKKIYIEVSLEGIAAHNDYIRYGSKWEIIDSHIKTLKQFTNIEIRINHVLQHTSLYTLPALIEYADNQNIILKLHEIYYNSYPGPGVLTINSADSGKVETFKIWLSTYLGQHKQLLLNWINSYQYDENLNNKFYAYVDMLDSIRKNNFNLTFKKTYDQQP
jgi:sulfatase maturation enzyme AslB (radical SAM superfamily)